MGELTKLISAWEEYIQKNNTASAAEFCMYFLAKERNQQLFGGLTPPDLDTTFAKLIGRLANMQTTYSKMALQDLPGFELEWFYFLNTIYHLKEVKKIQVIQYNFAEQTTGIDILNKLKKLGYITERTDPEDKRAKLVSLTKAGEKILFKVYQLLHKPTLLMYSDIDHKDKQVVVNILRDTETQHQAILSNIRNKSIDDLLSETLGEEKMAQIMSEREKMFKHWDAKRRSKE
ncbi:MarR family winged helix-turn-helix transcriptional regulator [Chitinophaga varians]|uniref:MarR family winged helix-turn-helix transcriptional regulator n=1 Tax=Chitinophaga varians TaxID=2202339 RepID=UPI00165F3D63|nr:winged helix DNA-binding protein [Chitinophaga varians]MBC9909888.1 winged helix DNA-binding protein [Chitinophaga varians]